MRYFDSLLRNNSHEKRTDFHVLLTTVPIERNTARPVYPNLDRENTLACKPILARRGR